MAASDALPIPRKNVAYRVTFPILDADGDLVTGATGLDSEVSKDAGTFTDCTNEATEIATSSGVYYLDLTSTEMNADTVAVIVKTSSSGAKTTTLVIYPEEAGDTRADVVWFGGAAGTFSGGRPEVNTTHAAGTAWGSGAITAAAIANGAIDAATFAPDVDAEVRGWLGLATNNLDTQLGDIPTVSEFNARTIVAASYALEATLGGLVTTVGVAGAGLTEAGGTGDQFTAIPWNASWDAEVQSEVADALAVYDPPTNAEMEARTLLAADYVIVSDLGTVQTGDGYAYLVANVGANGANLTAADNAVIAAIAALNNLSAAQVNAEIVDALATDTYTEPGQGTPAATTSITAKINYLYKAWRNKKTQTSTTFSLFADDASTVDQKATTSDDGTTTTIGEIATGP